MQFQFAFKHMESSDALRDYTENKLGDKIKKFVTKPIEAHVTFEVDRHEHRAHCSLIGGDGFNVQVEHSCEDMYGSVDRMTAKLETQLKRQKEKLKQHKQKSHRHLKPVTEEYVNDIENAAVDAEDIVKFEKVRGVQA